MRELVKLLANSKIFVGSDVDASLLRDVDVDLLASKAIESKKGAEGLAVINAKEIRDILEGMKVEKAPLPVEVIRSPDFKPVASAVDASYRIQNSEIQRVEGSVSDFVSYFNNRLDKMKNIIETRRATLPGLVRDLELLQSFTQGKEVTVVGIVSQKNTTKKGNLMITVEDDTGEGRIIFSNGTSKPQKELFEKAGRIINDEIIAVTGKIWQGMVMANEILLPDVPIKDKKVVQDDIAIAFLSDVHVGSKRFMEKNFLRMIDWLNGSVPSQKALAEKIKYVVIAGDVADGIGVYPGQERDLAVFDIYAQYRELFRLLEAIPEYIHVFVMPGNHDAVQRAEPQPPLTEMLLKDKKWNNIHIVTNPSFITMHGMDVLAYHGTSLDDTIASIPGLSYAEPEKAMIELLKRRHLSPVYGGKNVLVPSANDNMVIGRVPDILHMGHIHKNGISNYHGVEIVNSGTWQARTDFQIRSGHIPTPCILPVYEMKSHIFTQVNFAGEK